MKEGGLRGRDEERGSGTGEDYERALYRICIVVWVVHCAMQSICCEFASCLHCGFIGLHRAASCLHRSNVFASHSHGTCIVCASRLHCVLGCCIVVALYLHRGCVAFASRLHRICILLPRDCIVFASIRCVFASWLHRGRFGFNSTFIAFLHRIWTVAATCLHRIRIVMVFAPHSHRSCIVVASYLASYLHHVRIVC